MAPTQSSKPRDALATLRIERADAPPTPSIWWRLGKFLLLLIFLFAIVAGGMALAERQGWFSLVELITPRPEVRTSMVEVVHGSAADALVVATGYLESRRQANIGAKSPGRIQAIHVDEGTRVKKGQELAVLEHADLEAALSAAMATLKRTRAELVEHEARIKLYERDHNRFKRLLDSRSVSVDEYDDAKYTYDMAIARRNMIEAAIALGEARVQEAKQRKEDMFVRAPFDGTIISKDAEVGESILPGGMGEASGRGSVVTIADLDHLEVDTDVKEDYISRVRVGQPCEVAVDAVPDRRYKARVRKIVPMGDRARATIKVKVEVVDADERLFPEMSGTVYFLSDASDNRTEKSLAEKRVFCPSAAIQEHREGWFVWVVDADERISRGEISCGTSKDGRVEIEDGLIGGERVVLNPPADLETGQLIRSTD